MQMILFQYYGPQQFGVQNTQMACLGAPLSPPTRSHLAVRSRFPIVPLHSIPSQGLPLSATVLRALPPLTRRPSFAAPPPNAGVASSCTRSAGLRRAWVRVRRQYPAIRQESMQRPAGKGCAGHVGPRQMATWKRRWTTRQLGESRRSPWSLAGVVCEHRGPYPMRSVRASTGAQRRRNSTALSRF